MILRKCDRCGLTEVHGYNLRTKFMRGDMNITPAIFPNWNMDLCVPCWKGLVDFVESWGDAS